MEALRKAFESKFPDPQQFDPADVRRFRSDDALVKAFLTANDDDVDEALEQVEKSFDFRKEMSLNTLTDSSFPLEFRQKGSVFYHSHDKKGNKILYFRIRDNNRKEAAIVAQAKQFVAYLIDLEHRKDPSQQLVLLFDMTGAGLSNFDPDQVRFIITCFDTYFPNFLAYLLVFDMPFILNAAWKLIRNWLSEKAREKVIFVKRSTVTDYIAREQLWSHMGGLDDFEYVYESAVQEETEVEQQAAVSEESQELRRRTTDAANHWLPASANHSAPPSSPHRLLLLVSPADHLHFPRGVDESALTLRSNHAAPVAFKVNTTRPQDFRVRPSAGLLPPHHAADVAVTRKPAAVSGPAQAAARFQILALPVPPNTDKAAALGMLKAAGREALFEARLGCLVGEKPPAEKPAERTLAEAVEAGQRAVEQRLVAVQAQLRLVSVLVGVLLLLQLLLLLRPCR